MRAPVVILSCGVVLAASHPARGQTAGTARGKTLVIPYRTLFVFARGRGPNAWELVQAHFACAEPD